MKKLITGVNTFLLAGLVLAFGSWFMPRALAETKVDHFSRQPYQGSTIQKVRADLSGARYHQGYQRDYRSSERWQGSHRPNYHRHWGGDRYHRHYYGWRWYYYPSWWYGWPGYYYYYYYPWSPWWYW